MFPFNISAYIIQSAYIIHIPSLYSAAQTTVLAIFCWGFFFTLWQNKDSFIMYEAEEFEFLFGREEI